MVISFPVVGPQRKMLSREINSNEFMILLRLMRNVRFTVFRKEKRCMISDLLYLKHQSTYIFIYVLRSAHTAFRNLMTADILVFVVAQNIKMKNKFLFWSLCSDLFLNVSTVFGFSSFIYIRAKGWQKIKVHFGNNQTKTRDIAFPWDVFFPGAIKDVILDRIEREYLFYFSNLVVNGIFGS